MAQTDDIIGNLVKGLPAHGNVDLSDPRIAHIIADALVQLGYCDDTLALLVQRLGLTDGQTYLEIRQQFPHGRLERR